MRVLLFMPRAGLVIDVAEREDTDAMSYYVHICLSVARLPARELPVLEAAGRFRVRAAPAPRSATEFKATRWRQFQFRFQFPGRFYTLTCRID